MALYKFTSKDYVVSSGCVANIGHHDRLRVQQDSEQEHPSTGGML